MVIAQSEPPHQKRFTLVAITISFEGKRMEVNTRRMVALNGVNYVIQKGKWNIYFMSRIFTNKYEIDEEWKMLHK